MRTSAATPAYGIQHSSNLTRADTPYAAPIDHARRQRLAFRPAVRLDQRQIVTAREVQRDHVHRQRDDPRVRLAQIIEVGHEVDGQSSFGQCSVSRLEVLAQVGGIIEHQRRFVKLHFRHTECLEFAQKLRVERQKLAPTSRQNPRPTAPTAATSPAR